ncbi:MAG: NAD(P)/FAD-dependent oxidoreductase [Bacteroidaceae bacterium]|nr:NAD(P)/FAD-dependent oxidoreductase [Bacteroidaceae bacterium]
MKYDVVIIGSGLGGLICAHEWARRGRSVLVLERQRQPGGCLQSYRRGGLEFDTGLHYVGGLAEGQPLHEAFKRLGLLGLEWQRLDADGFDRITIGEQTFCMAEGYDRFAETMAAYFPEEREALKDYVKMLQRVVQNEADTVGLMGTNAYDYLCNKFRNPLLVNVLSGAAMKLELRRESLPLFTFAHAQSSYIQSSWRLKGSGNVLVQTLIDGIRRLGGQIVCNADVEELIMHDGRVLSAFCKDGEHYEGDVFISDVHPAQTICMVKTNDIQKSIYRKRLLSLENTTGMFTASLVLKPNTLPYFNHNKYVYREANVWEAPMGGTTIDRVMVSARVPEDGTSYVRQIDLLTPMPWTSWQHWQDTKVGRRGEIYELQKERLADACILLAERVIPGLGTMVDKCFTSTPLTWRDYTLSPCGSAFGVRKDCRTPLLTMLSPKTPVPNLFLTGQSLAMHGVEGVTMAALETIKSLDL